MRPRYATVTLLLLLLSIPTLSRTASIPVLDNQHKPIRLAEASFDPLLGPPPIAPLPGRKGAVPSPPEYYFVQLSGPIEEASKQALITAGAELHDYIPDFTFLVRMSASTKKAVERLPFIRWIGAYGPRYRLQRDLRLRLQRANSATTAGAPRSIAEPGVLTRDTSTDINRSNVVIVLFKGTDMDACDKQIATAGGTVLKKQAGLYKSKILARVDDKDLGNVASVSGVKWIEPEPEWKLHNNVSATVTNVRPCWDAHGLRGTGQVVAVCDTGLDAGSSSPASLLDDFEDGSGGSRVIYIQDWAGDSPSDTNGHGTHVAGSVLGNGKLSGSSPSAHNYPTTSVTGMAPESELIFQAVMNDGTGALSGIPLDLNTLFDDSRNRGAHIQTNSWGSSAYSGYDSDSQDVDENSWTNKYFTIVFSAGNDGTDSDADGVIDLYSMGSPATAKNCITVGASENDRPGQQYEYPQNTCNTATWGWFDPQGYSANPLFSDGMSDAPGGIVAFSSRGPCLDGRYKPDIVAPGSFVLSTKSSLVSWEQWGQCGLTAQQTPYYVFMGGTSMSTPLVAGMCALIRQYFTDGNYPSISVPSSALIKAMLLNGSTDLNPGQYPSGPTQEIPGVRPNNVEGWGRADIENSLFPSAPRDHMIRDRNTGLATAGTHTFQFDVTTSAEPLNATLAWTDHWGTPLAAGGLVNDLDMELLTPSGTLYPTNARRQIASTHLTYVDGYWDTAGSGSSGTGRAVKFTPSSYPKTVQSVRFYLVSAASGAVSGTCNIWDDDGPSGMPGTQLFTKNLTVRLTYMGSFYEGWITVEPTAMADITSGSFYVEFRWTGSTVYLGYDSGVGQDTGNDYYYSGSSWSAFNQDQLRDYYIEAVVSDQDTGGDADRTNNVEQIDVTSPQTGTWTAKVTGYNIPMGPQPFALVVSGPITYDSVPPNISNISRETPSAQYTNASEVTWRVTFDEDVQDVSTTDFGVTKLSGTVAGYSITSASAVSASAYDVTVNTGTGEGELRLDFSASATVWDLAGNAVSNAPFTSGQTFSLDRTPPASLALVTDPTMAGTTVPITFTAADSGGAGLQQTTLYVKLPGSGTFADAGLSPVSGSGGTFIYSPPIDGGYEFCTRASDTAGNTEDIPISGDTTTLFNVDVNSSFPQSVVAGGNVAVFPMTNDLDVTITLSGVSGAGALIVSRETPLTSPPGYFRYPDKILGEALNIDGSGLPAFTDATIEWAFEPTNDSLGADPVNSAFRFEGDAYKQSYSASRSGSVITIPAVTGFSTWYAGNGVAVPVKVTRFAVE